LILIVIAAVFFAMLRPFLISILLAAILAGLIYPVYNWMRRRIWNQPVSPVISQSPYITIRIAGLRISPSMVMVPFMQPNECLCQGRGGGGVTKATGAPFLVTSTGSPVFFRHI